MRKSRVFIFIAAVLITLLMSVACDNAQVFEPKENGLVKAAIKIGEESTKGIVIWDSIADVTTYRIALIPEWEKLENGTQIYGGFGSLDSNGRIVDGNDYSASVVTSLDLGYVTPGKWTIYVEALNSSNKIIQEGKSTVFFTKDSTDAVVFLLPVNGNNGKLHFSISVQQLNLDVNEFKSNYNLKYDVVGTNTSNTATGLLDTSINSDYRLNYIKELNLPQDEYLVTVSLVTSDNEFVGGITRVVRIVDSGDSYFSGDVTPEEFISVELETTAPSISVSMSSKPEYSVNPNGEVSFTCSDNTGNVENFNRSFFWYINGEKIAEEDYSINEGENTSTFTYSTDSTDNKYFPGYGRYEVKCEVVYYANSISYIGSASSVFQIVP